MNGKSVKESQRVRVLESPEEPRLEGATGVMVQVPHWGLCMKLAGPRDGFPSGHAYLTASDQVEVLA